MRHLIHFVSHTHWDREWYEPLEAYRYRLVKLVDNLLGVMGNDPLYQNFMLDGQIVALEDYLEVRPEKENELRSLVENGRVLVGPWYILPDEFLISGETHIRNLMIGINLSRRFGRWMRVGYLPDSFGHIGQIPQILAKSGIPYAAFWRGAGRNVKSSEFFWEAPDGSKVLTVFMPFGYSNACNLPPPGEALRQRLEAMVTKLSPYANSKHILLMNGSDHVEPDPSFPAKLRYVRQEMDEHDYCHSTLPFLFSLLEKELELHSLPVYRGEWREGDLNYLLGGTLSTRMYLKQAHHDRSSFLEGQAEPLASVLFSLGATYPEHLFRFLWKGILKNSTHDAICGCSCDDVHREMVARYRGMEEIERKWLADIPGTLEDSLVAEGKENLVVFNPHPFPVTEYLETDLLLDKKLIEEADFENARIAKHDLPRGEFPKGIRLTSSEDAVTPAVLEREWSEVIETPPHTLPEIYQARRYRVGFVARDLPPMGFRVYRVEPVDTQTKVSYEHKEALENEFYRVESDAQGAVTLTHRPSGLTFPLELEFEDTSDAGDEYDWSPCPEEKVVSSNEVQPAIRFMEHPFRSTMELRYNVPVPSSLSLDRKGRSAESVDLPIALRISVSPGVDRVDFNIQVDNRAHDHRLRMVFNFPVESDRSYADGHFTVVERRAEKGTTYHQRHFVCVQDEEHSFWVYNRGLPEYETIPSGKKTRVAVTLLRAVGWLSRGDLATRPGNAGWPILTPDAQCVGEHEYALALAVDTKPFPESTCAQAGRTLNLPPLAIPMGKGRGRIGNGWSLFSCDNPHITLSACKKREGREELVIRLYNHSSCPQRALLTFATVPEQVRELSPIEEDGELVKLESNVLEAGFEPHEIKTWGVFMLPRSGEA